MLREALMFLLASIVAGVLGFVGIAGAASWTAKLLSIAFLVLSLFSLVRGRRWGGVSAR